MSGLLGVLGLGARALGAFQLDAATAGNNAANALTPGYSRRRAVLAELPPVTLGRIAVGSGVGVATLERLRDALADRRWRAVQGELGLWRAQGDALAAAETVLGAPGDNALLEAVTQFLAGWGELAVHPEDLAARQTVLTEAETLAGVLRRTAAQLATQRAELATALADTVAAVNDTARRLADLNRQLQASRDNPALADERDRLLDQLARDLGIRTLAAEDGTTSVLLEGTGLALVSGPRAATLALAYDPATDTYAVTLDGTAVSTPSGTLGGLLEARDGATGLRGLLAQLDTFARDLIAAVNARHAVGTGLEAPTTVTGSVTVADPAVPLAAAGLWRPPTAGALTLGAVDAGGTIVASGTVAVDPAAMSLADLAAAIDGLPGVVATVSGGRLVVSAETAGQGLVFGPDSSGVLVALGVHGLFTGTDARTIAVDPALRAAPAQLATGVADFGAGRVAPGDNRTAAALAALGQEAVIGGMTPDDFLASLTGALGVASRAAADRARTVTTLADDLERARQAVAGVNLDEELAHLLQAQQAYGAAATLVRVANDMLDTLLRGL